jgi:hypothetical protein
MAKKFVLILVTSVFYTPFGYANDMRCSAPPYGDTVAAFQAFVKYFGQYVPPAKFLSGICDVKYGGADRTPLYNLGFTDKDIETKSTADLGVDMLTALRRLAKQTGP